MACSASEQALSIVSLTLTGTNASTSPVSPRSIAVSIPAGSWTDDNSLTAQPDVISAAPGPATPWAIAGYAGDWNAFPLPPASSIPPKGSISFVFSNVVVNLNQSMSVDVTVTETVNGGQATAPPVVLKKTEAVGPSTQAPSVTSFAVDQTEVALGQTVTFTWATQNADVCLLAPGQVPLTPPAVGTLALSIPSTAVYTLTALSKGGTAVSEALTVTVESVAVDSFTADPPTVSSGAPATLAWKTRHASGCSIDQGVGPVAVSGQTVVKPAATTTYSLTANGLDPEVQEVTVTVQ